MKHILHLCILLLLFKYTSAQESSPLPVTTTDGEIPIYVEILIFGDTSISDTLFPQSETIWLNCPGFYHIYAYAPGYDEIILNNFLIDCDHSYELVLGEKKYPVRNANLDPLNAELSWQKPMITALLERFTYEYIPEGWSNSGDNWVFGQNGCGGGFNIPPWNSHFAFINDSINNQSDTLITPFMKLHEANNYQLCFDSYFDGQGNQAAIYYSFDAWQSKELLTEIIPTEEWAQIYLDLSGLSGPYSKDICFGFVGSQWAIDNVDIRVLSDSLPEVLGYHCFLNDSLVQITQDTSCHFDILQFGDNYTAGVSALYSSGLTGSISFDFTSEFLYIPRDLAAASYDNAIYIMWKPPLMPDTTSGDSGRDLWDTQFTYPCGDASGEAGIESDGNYIYTSKWNAGNGTFFRYELDGTFIGSFAIDGCMDVRDLAYDGELFWGSNAGTTLWGMDFEDEVVVETINAPVAVRAIAYDEEFDAFWANNWSTTITLFDKDGITLNSFSCGSWSSYYGFAWDNSQPGGPYLYGFSNEASGAVIVEMEIATGQETGFTYDAIGFSATGTGVAGGLFIQDNIVQGYKTLGGMVQNETIFGLDLGEAGSGPGPLVVPENLLGFNLYKDDEFLDYIEYVEGQNQIEYWDFDVDPGCHAYEVSGIYDLYPYGLPGDSAESANCGPAIICGGTYFILPFMEDWESGTFENMYWSVTSENWSVNTSYGNPGNSAEFSGTPELNGYTHMLKSYFLDGFYLTEGKLILECQVKLKDQNENISEKLIVGVETNDVFYSLDTLVNSGTTEWLDLQYDLTDFTMGSFFQLVFKVEGENSSNIEGWFIDNILVYHMCDEPTNLSLEPEYGYEYTIAHLDWEPPFAPYHWLYYHDNAFENAVSAMEPTHGFAQLFEPEAHPATIQKAKFFIGDHLNYQNNIDVYILSGDGNAILAGPVTVNAVEGNSWITINFGDISIVDGNFLVYIQNIQENGPFLAVDDQTDNPKLYYGNIGNFTELQQWGYRFVSSCQAYIKYSTSDNIVENSKAPEPVSHHFKPQFLLSNKTSFPENAENDRSLIGYNIWRNDELIEIAWPESQYTDTLYEAGEYNYFISAVYDQCESDTSGTVSISLFTDVNTHSETNQINIYPNPATDELIVELKGQEGIIHHFTLTSVSGQPVLSLSPESRRIRLDVSLLPKGIYLAEIFSGEKREFRKIIIY